MPFGIQPVHLIVIALVALLVFGPSKLPDIGRGVGKAIVEFRRGMQDLSEGYKEEAASPVPPVMSPVVYQSAAPAQPAIPPAPVQAVPTPGVTYCSICGSPNSVEARFCNACGSAIPADSPVPSGQVMDAQTGSPSVVDVESVQISPDEPADSTANH